MANTALTRIYFWAEHVGLRCNDSDILRTNSHEDEIVEVQWVSVGPAERNMAQRGMLEVSNISSIFGKTYQYARRLSRTKGGRQVCRMHGRLRSRGHTNSAEALGGARKARRVIVGANHTFWRPGHGFASSLRTLDTRQAYDSRMTMRELSIGAVDRLSRQSSFSHDTRFCRILANFPV